jgi:DNA processing protein
MSEHLPYLLALNHINGIGAKTIQRLLQAFNSPQNIFEATRADLMAHNIPANVTNQIIQKNFHLVELDLKWQGSNNQTIIDLFDDNYPPLLKEIHDPPLILYAKGNLLALDGPAIAIVGTRKPSISGIENAKYFARALSNASLTIVSGLALGIDAVAHRTVIDNKRPTIAVLGTGIMQTYPKQNVAIYRSILENGLILSEFPLNSPVKANHFPQRNRIISGLSLGTLIVEAALKSGSLITARFALEQNREVFAIPGSLQNPEARGCHHLLQQGAMLTTSPDDILMALSLLKRKDLANQSSHKDENRVSSILSLIQFETTSIDLILNNTKLSYEDVLMELTTLELQGDIVAVTGGYTRCES